MATLNVARQVLQGLGVAESDTSGRFFIDGSMVNVELSKAIVECIYIGEIFRAGQSVTDKYTTDTKAGTLRVPIDIPIPHSSRTLAFGGRLGTTNNGGRINVNPAILPSTDEILIYLNQINDQPMMFDDIRKEYIPLDVMSTKLESYANAVAEDRSASILAEIIAYNIYRALKADLASAGDGNEVLNIFNGSVTEANQNADLTTSTAQYAYGKLIPKLHTKLSRGDLLMNAHTYPSKGRCIIGRSNFINNALTINSGLILLGADMAQSMIKDWSFDKPLSERNYVGNSYKGNAAGFDFQEAADYVWTLAEKYLGLDAGALDFVDAIAVSYDATAVGKNVDLGVKVVDATNGRGSLAQPLNIWGMEAFRKSQLICGGTNTTIANLVAAIKAIPTSASATTPAFMTAGTTNGTTYTTAEGAEANRRYPISPNLDTTGFDTVTPSTGFVIPTPHG